MNAMQVSLFLENKSGRLAHVTETLAQENINIRALSIADTSDFGILRLVVDQPQKAFDKLKEQGFTVMLTEIIAVAVEDVPGGLNQVLKLFQKNSINLEYMYAYMGRENGKAVTVFRVEDADKATVVLTEAGIQVLSGEELQQP